MKPLLLAGCLLSLWSSAFLQAEGALRAAVAKIDITPEQPQWLLGYHARQSTGVHDRLYHRILVLDDGATQLALVSTDICMVGSMAFYDQVRRRVETETGLHPGGFWWFFTHTHSAPEVGPPGLARAFMPERYKQASAGSSNPEYTELVTRRLLDGIQQARARLAPARFTVGTGFASANINRRARDVDGSISLGLNPDGPVDRQIGLVRLERSDGSPLALIANYAVHGTVLSGRNLLISGDAPGVVAEYVEQKLGAPMLFINGAQGNIAPLYSVYPDPKSGHLSQFRVLLGDPILEAIRRLGPASQEAGFRLGEIVVETPLKAGLEWPEELADYLRVTAAGEKLVRIPVRFLRLDRDTVIWAAPLELFCEIALQVRQRSRFPHTFYFGLVSGWMGYLPTAQALREKGYEASVSPYTERAEDDFTQAVLGYLQGLPR
jgi:hypothetical protein